MSQGKYPAQQGCTLTDAKQLQESASKTAAVEESHPVTQAGVKWHDLGSLQFSPPGFKRLLYLSLPIEMGFRHLGQAALELLILGDPPTSASQSVGITGMESRTVARLVCSGTISACCNLHLPGSKYSGTISAHCNLHLLDTSDSLASASQVARITGAQLYAWLIFVFLLEMGFHHLGQAGLELLTSGDPPALASQTAGMTGSSDSPTSASGVAGTTCACHQARLIFVFLVEMGFRHFGQSGLELLTSGDPPASASQSAEIIGMSHRAWPTHQCYCMPRLECGGMISPHCSLNLLHSRQQGPMHCIFQSSIRSDSLVNWSSVH
ncbi:hypothetical protein AAY473_017119 [Plecturocebus cupreus]